MLVSTFRNLEQQAVRERYNEIYTHELAHKNAGGALAGTIVIEKGSNGVPISGYVPIKMPVLDSDNPEKTIQQANIVIKAAMAPNNPSAQDYKVAAQAESIKSQATRLDYYA